MKKDKNNPVIQLPSKQSELAAAVSVLKTDFDVHIEYACIIAKIRFNQYTEYVKAGFTEKQALELCKGV